MKDNSSNPKPENKSSEDSTQHDSGRSVKKQVFTALGLLTCLVIATVFVVLYARGYRLFVDKGTPGVSKTGILHITSNPTSAQVYIDGHPTTATNGTINLAPKKYTVKVAKDGYTDWQKDIQIEAEVVTGADALLFPKSPTLQSISTFGVEQALIDPSGTKLAFKIASQSAKRNGIYIFDMTARNLPILQGQSSANQIADDTLDKFSDATLTWSPDSKELMASISARLSNPVSPDTTASESASASPTYTYYLLKTDSLNDAPQDISTLITETLDLWRTQLLDKQKARVKSLKPKVAQFSSQYFRILSWSPDESKILYQASESAQMPEFLKPRRIGNNLLYERRDLKKGAIYAYDIREDINTRIVDTIDEICVETKLDCLTADTALPRQKNPFSWFPDSSHLLYVHDKKIQIVEDDGANLTTIYAGPFLGQYVFPWPDGSKIVILTNLGNPSVSPTLYTIGLK